MKSNTIIQLTSDDPFPLPIEWLDTTVRTFVNENEPKHKIGDVVGSTDLINQNVSKAKIVSIQIPYNLINLFYEYNVIFYRDGRHDVFNEEQIEGERQKLIRMLMDKIKTLPLDNQLRKDPRSFLLQKYGWSIKQSMSFKQLLNLSDYLRQRMFKMKPKTIIQLTSDDPFPLPIEWLDTTVRTFVNENEPKHKIGDVVGSTDLINQNVSKAKIVSIQIPYNLINLFYEYNVIFYRDGRHDVFNEEQIEGERKRLIRMIGTKVNTLPLTHQLQKNPREFYLEKYGKRNKQVMSFQELIDLSDYLNKEA